MYSFLEIYVCVAYICIYFCVYIYIYIYICYIIYIMIYYVVCMYIYYINTSGVDMLGNVNECILFFLFIMKTLKFFT